MDEDDNLDVNAWLGKPPERPQPTPASEAAAEDHAQSAAASPSPSPPPSASSRESDLVEIPHRPAPAQADASEADDQSEADRDNVQDDVDELQLDNDVSMVEPPEEVDGFVVNRQRNLSIHVPELTEDERDSFDYLPDHFTAKRILYALPDRQYIVKLATGEVDLVSLI